MQTNKTLADMVKKRTMIENSLKERFQIEEDYTKINIVPEKTLEYEGLREEFFQLCKSKLHRPYQDAIKIRKKQKTHKVKATELEINVAHNFALGKLFEEWIRSDGNDDLWKELDDVSCYRWMFEWNVQFRAVIDGKLNVLIYLVRIEF